jgi:hypothetical protein
MAEYNGKSTKAHLKDHDTNDFGHLHITARTADPAKHLVNKNFVGDSSQLIEIGNSAQRPKNAGCRIATEECWIPNRSSETFGQQKFCGR